MSNLCSCYREHAYINLNGDFTERIVHGCCYGTKEREYCECGGDREKCDLYLKKRHENVIKTTKKDSRRDIIIQNIKDCGQSLIDNAEKMVAEYEFPYEEINIYICAGSTDEAPTIKVEAKFIPENAVKRKTE